MASEKLNRRDFTRLTAAAFGGLVAGTVISGRFSMEFDAIDPGDVKLVGLQSGDVESSPDTLSGP